MIQTSERGAESQRQVIQRPGSIMEYVGEAARVRLNNVGQVVTVIPTSRRGFRILEADDEPAKPDRGN
jgi:hypothetical protein